jgi:GT2 family glycosyltransferase
LQTPRRLAHACTALMPGLSSVAGACDRALHGLFCLLLQRGGARLWIDRLLFLDPPLYWLCKSQIHETLREYLRQELNHLVDFPAKVDLSTWFHRYRPSERLLQQFRRRRWPSYAPRFTVMVRVCDQSTERLTETLTSISRQTYSSWETILVTDATSSICVATHELPAERAIPPSEGLKAAKGDYICFADEGDVLEPHALHRFAEAIVHAWPDLLYSDEVSVANDLNTVLSVAVRPAFSYDRYLAHTYFGHLLAIKTKALHEAGGLPNKLRASDQLDTVLRVIEKATAVSHVPDILYRHRQGRHPGDLPESAGEHMASLRAVERHLERIGCPAEVRATDHSACREVCFPIRDHRPVAIIVPTKDRADLLRRCIASVEATVSKEAASIIVVDHESCEAQTVQYLQELRARHKVISYEGDFNFSAMMNHAVASLSNDFSGFLFLNNDVEALSPGWLDHMRGLANRSDVGIVGSLLLYPGQTVQHAGAIVGLHYGAGHIYTDAPAFDDDGHRVTGPDMALLSTRDQSAVTGACLLIRADVFHRIGGFNPSFRVGYGDTDLCLRTVALGYKVLFDPFAMLVHYESSTRGKLRCPHPEDTQLFRARYLQLILAGDPCHSPFWSRRSERLLNPCARAMRDAKARTTPVILPRPIDD